MTYMNDRWAIYIDIEGFGVLYEHETTVLMALSDLMEGIYAIGTKCYPESPNRLFAHQTGNGFIIVSEFGAASLEVPVAIAIALLRHVAVRGRFAKASIGEGEFADILGCYPKRIQEAHLDGGTVPLGGGIMTIFQVMGTALIDAVGVMKRSPSGSLLTLDANKRSRLPSECIIREAGDQTVLSVDWAHSTLPLVAYVQQLAELHRATPEQIEVVFHRYCAYEQPPKPWVDSTAAMLGFRERF
jgi:hypothetical protein